jgi:predicted RNA-binding protein YlqC (UPF0109 family)
MPSSDEAGAFAACMQRLSQTMVCMLVDDSGAVEVTSIGGQTMVKLEIRVAPHDRDRAIGSQKQTINAFNALQTLVQAAGARMQRHVLLEIIRKGAEACIMTCG